MALSSSQARCRLDTLPVEIIQRIASCGPCESALALGKVCSTLHRACNNRFVFKSIIDNGNGRSFENDDWQCTAVTSQCSTSECARWALADSQARQLVELLEGNARWSVTFDDFWLDEYTTWAPQIMALHHCLNTASGTLFPILLERLSQKWDKKHLTQAQALSFCLAATMLSVKELGGGLLTADIQRKMPGDQSFHPPRRARDRTHDRPPTVQHRVANQVLGVFALDLREALAEPDSLSHIGSGGATPIRPPFAADIPFPDLMDLPLPFTEEVTDAFSTCHLRTMTSVAFLEDGEWTGYYTYPPGSPRRSHSRFDPPMVGIKFSVEQYDNNDDTINNSQRLRLRANAEAHDYHGRFTLEGYIVPTTGGFSMTKQYVGRHSFPWDGVMTPFGFLGSWEYPLWPGGHTKCGWFWLWKTSWTTEP
jgi:hypothetical protein